MNKLDKRKEQKSISITISVPLSLKEQLERSSKKNCRTITKEILFRLLTTFSKQEEMDENLIIFLEKLMQRKKLCNPQIITNEQKLTGKL